MSERDDKLVEALDAIGVHRDVHGYADSIDAGDGLVLHLVPGTELNERNVEAFAALLRQAATALAEARANHEGALKASAYWHDLYRKECRLRQDDAARYGQQLEDAESELAALRADAERYRWLRDEASDDWEVTQYVGDDTSICHLASGDLDAAIDAATADAARGEGARDE